MLIAVPLKTSYSQARQAIARSARGVNLQQEIPRDSTVQGVA